MRKVKASHNSRPLTFQDSRGFLDPKQLFYLSDHDFPKLSHRRRTFISMLSLFISNDDHIVHLPFCKKIMQYNIAAVT